MAQISSAPPPYRPSLDAASLHSQASQTSYCHTPISQPHPRGTFSPGLKRNSDVAFGSDTDNGESLIDTSLVYPALTAEDSPQQSDPVNRAPSSSGHQPAGSPLSIWPSAFTIPSQIIKNTRKNRRTWIWLAPWSTWSFTLRLMLMLGSKLQPGVETIPPQLVEDDVYNLSWDTRPPNEKPDVGNLPSLDYAIYLFHTFKFHIGQTYRLFDEVEFVNQIRDFYSDAQRKAEENRLWYVKFLLILAFGTAFHLSQPLSSGQPPGSKFFVRAMGLMPDHTALWKDSLFAIEILAMVGLYLYSIDQRESAHVYFLEQTKAILRTLAHHAQEIERIISLKFKDNTGDTMPRGTKYIMLLYHQCVIVATRPLLLSVLKERLDILGHPGNENSEAFLGQTATVISTGIKSAVKTLQILTSEYSLLEVFLPYDLEFTFAAALHLNMATALFPGVADDEGCQLLVHQLLDTMIARGNRLATVRKQELVYLEAQCQELVVQVQQQGLQTLSLAVTDEDEEQQQRLLAAASIPMEAAALPMYCVQNPITSDMEFLDNIGISSEDFMSIVNQIGDPDIMPENMLTLE
ncbi:hypothetical protein ACHAPI_011012 [Fusarium lateritium]